MPQEAACQFDRPEAVLWASVSGGCGTVQRVTERKMSVHKTPGQGLEFVDVKPKRGLPSREACIPAILRNSIRSFE